MKQLRNKMTAMVVTIGLSLGTLFGTQDSHAMADIYNSFPLFGLVNGLIIDLAIVAGPITGPIMLTKEIGNCISNGGCSVDRITDPLLITFFGPFIGLYMLDEKSMSLGLNAISKSKANELGLDLSHVQIYNSEIEQINALLESASMESVKFETAEQAVQWGSAKWHEIFEQVSPQTRQVLLAAIKNAN